MTADQIAEALTSAQARQLVRAFLSSIERLDRGERTPRQFICDLHEACELAEQLAVTV